MSAGGYIARTAWLLGLRVNSIMFVGFWIPAFAGMMGGVNRVGLYPNSLYAP